MGACVWGRCLVSVPHQISLLTEYEGPMGVCVYVLARVQNDTAAHTLSVFSIGYHEAEQLVTEEVGQTIGLGGSRK